MEKINFLTAAEDLFQAKKYDYAFEYALKAVGENPQNGAAYTMMCKILLRQKKYEEALEQAHKGLALNPQSDDGHYWCAEVHWEQKRYVEAERELRMTLDCPNNSRSYYLTALAHLIMNADQQRIPEALQLCHQALEINPNRAYAHRITGWAYELQGDLVKTEEHYREALRLDPLSAWIHEKMAELEIKRGNLAQAEIFMTESLRLHPTATSNQKRLAWIKHQLNPTPPERESPQRTSGFEDALNRVLDHVADASMRIEKHPLVKQVTQDLQSIGQSSLAVIKYLFGMK